MFTGFKEFLFKTNALALAIGVIIGAAVGKVVSSLVADILMPVISLLIPSGDWRSAKIQLGNVVTADGKTVPNSINYGVFIGNIIDFLIIALCVYFITKAFLDAPSPPDTKECPRCKETVLAEANRCKFCAADI